MMQHQITLAQAIELTSNFRANPGEDMPYAETFSAGSVKALLEQEGCHSFRIYLGRKTDDRICSVLVAVDENGQDILPPNNPALLTEEGIILEDAFQCPPVCPPPSPLNG